MDQTNLLENLVNFNDKARSKNKKDTQKRDAYESAYALYEDRELTLILSKVRYFQ